MTELATATAAVAVMTLGMEKAGNVESDDADTEVSARGSGLIVCSFAFGKVKWIGVSLPSESKLSSFFTKLSSVLEAEEIPESEEVGLCSGEILSVSIYLGVHPETEKWFCNLTNATVKQPVIKMPLYLCFVYKVPATLLSSRCWGRQMREKPRELPSSSFSSLPQHSNRHKTSKY